MRIEKNGTAIEAVQWWPEMGATQGVEFHIGRYVVQTEAGPVTICPGDWVITAADGKRSVCDSATMGDPFALDEVP
jgi:hypothetical protein